MILPFGRVRAAHARRDVPPPPPMIDVCLRATRGAIGCPVLVTQLRAVLLIAVTACGAGTASEAPHRAKHPETTTIAGAAIEVPTDWWLASSRNRVTIEDPDRQLRITIIASNRREAHDAITDAWQQATPGFALVPSEEPDSPPPTGGWDAITTIHYTTPTAAAREVRAVWRRFGERGYVALIEGDRNALERRDAQVETIVGSVRPAGMAEETFAGRSPRALEAASLDAFVRRASDTLHVPGAAIAVIVDGRVVYERAFGVRTLGEPAPITPDTRFLLASITKPMTTLMQGALVDAGTLRWDTPVTRLLPSFALGDPAMTRELVLWQMSCACTGMPRQDLEGLFEWDRVTPESRLAMMSAMKPTTKLGETFQYSNPMVAAGGYAAAHAYAPDRPLADAYAAAMQDKLFGPIGMASTTLDFATVQQGEHARPHALAIDGTTHVMPLAIERGVEPIAPAGGVWTTLRDMERYVQTELAEGVAPGGRRVVSVASVRERGKLRVRSSDRDGYGLGLDVGTYAGLRNLAHHGGSFGFGTTMFMLPDQHVGIIILTNVRNGGAKEQLPFNTAVARRILEALYAGARPLAEQQLAYFAKLRVALPRVASSDRAWIKPLVGRYRDAALGDVEIRETPTGPVFDAGEWATAIDRTVDPDGTVKLVLLDAPFAGGTLIVEPGKLLIPGQTSYVFLKTANTP